MMVNGGLAVVFAYKYLPKMGWLAGGMIAGSVVSALLPQYAQPILLVIYSTWPGIFYLAWKSAGQKRKATTRRKRSTGLEHSASPFGLSGSQEVSTSR